MFEKKKITDDNLKIVSEEVYCSLVSTGMYPDVSGYLRENFYRAIYFFVSIIELLDRCETLSYDAYLDYTKTVFEEAMLRGNFDFHKKQCQGVAKEDDFIVDAANEIGRSSTDMLLAEPVINFLGLTKTNFDMAISHCRKILAETATP